MGAALAEDDVSRDDEFGVGFFGAETLAGALFGAVGAALGGVRGGARVAGLCNGVDGGLGFGGSEGEAVEGEEEGGGWGKGDGVEAWLEHCWSVERRSDAPPDENWL